MSLCSTGCRREAVVASLFCPGCSSAIGWHASGRTDVAFPDRLPLIDPVTKVAVDEPPVNRSKKTTSKAKK